LIDDGMRQGLLDQFPSAVPITVLATGTDFYVRASARRTGLTLLPLGSATAGMPAIGDGNVIVDGLDLLAEPATALRAVRGATSNARIFALVSHAAYWVTLLKFLAGDALATAHPFLAADVDALFAEGGWRAVDRIALVDRSIGHGPIPYAVSNRGVTLTVTSAEIAERVSTAGFFIIADPQ
jgi:hypothetical protein